MRCARSGMVCKWIAGLSVVLFAAVGYSQGDEPAAKKNKPRLQRQESSQEPAQLRKARAEVARAEQALNDFASNADPFGGNSNQLDRLKKAAEHARTTLKSMELAYRRTMLRKAIDGEDANAAVSSQSAEVAIRAALDKEIPFEFLETPLSEVAEFIRDYSHINVMLDQKSLEDIGVGTETPVTMKARHLSLRSALKLVLKPLDLAWAIDSEVLLITSIDEASQRLTTEVLDVSDLLEWDQQLRRGQRISMSEYDYDSLIDLITSSVAVESWGEVGGPGSISGLYGTLIVSQTTAVHEQIERLLTKLRKVRETRAEAPAEQPPLEARAPADPQAMLLRVYKIGAGWSHPGGLGVVGGIGQLDKNNVGQFGGGGLGGGAVQPMAVPNYEFVKQLAEIIPTVVVPESWAPAGNGIIRPAPSLSTGNSGSLVVRNSEQVHRQIQQFLETIEATPQGQSHGRTGGGGGFF